MRVAFSQNRPSAAVLVPTTSVIVVVIIALFLLLGAASAQEILTTRSLFEGIQAGIVDAILDVRSEDEWKTGHIENATLVADLALSNNFSMGSVLEGCRSSTLVVMCRSGHRAGKAIERLRTEYNFTGTLYNGMGISQWTMAGYPLVTTDSVPPPCRETCGGQQPQKEQASLTDASPTSSASPAPRPVPNPNFSLTAPPTLSPNVRSTTTTTPPSTSSPSWIPDPDSNEPAILSTPGTADTQMTVAQKASESSFSSSPVASPTAVCLLLVVLTLRAFVL